MPYAEYLDWMKFYALEPWGSAVEDERAATTINYILASQLGSEHKWIETKHLFPRQQSDWEARPKPEDDAESVAAGLRSFFQDRNARLAAKEDPTT